MSKTTQQKTLGVIANVHGVPSSSEEYDEMAGEVGACLTSATDNAIYRGYLPKFREAFVTAVEAETGIARNFETKETKAGKETKIYEKDTTYMARVCAEQGCENSAFQHIADNVSESLQFSLVSSRGKIGKEWIGKAEELIEKTEGNLDKFVDKITTNLPGFAFEMVDGQPTVESVAFAIKAEVERVTAAALADV